MAFRCHAESTMDFLHDRSRVIGQPEISTDGFKPCMSAVRDAFGPYASQADVNDYRNEETMRIASAASICVVCLLRHTQHVLSCAGSAIRAADRFSRQPPLGFSIIDWVK